MSTLRLFHLAIVLGFAFHPLSAMSATHYDVYILSGQSNMDGRGKSSELTGELAKFAKPHDHVRINYSNSTLRGPYTSGGWKPLEPGYSVPPGAKDAPDKKYTLPGRTFGPEIGFAHALAADQPDTQIAIIKFSEGGTNLRSNWDPDNADGIYPQFLAHVRSSLKSLTDAGDTFTLKAMVWHQGESDASLPPGEYEKLLAAFIARVRADLNTPNLLFVVGEVFDNGKRDNVRAGQLAVSKSVPNVRFVPASNLTTSDNGTHFDTKSTIALGQRFANALPDKKDSP